MYVYFMRNFLTPVFLYDMCVLFISTRLWNNIAFRFWRWEGAYLMDVYHHFFMKIKNILRWILNGRENVNLFRISILIFYLYFFSMFRSHFLYFSSYILEIFLLDMCHLSRIFPNKTVHPLCSIYVVYYVVLPQIRTTK